MHADDKNNELASATTLTNGRPGDSQATESEYLAAQADAARLAISRSLGAVRASLKSAGDVKAWTREYPWPSLGLAAVAGFLAAEALVAPRRHTKEPPGPLEHILTDEQITQRLHELAAAGGANSAWHRWLDSLISSLVQILGQVLQSVVVAVLATHLPPASVNGQASADANPPNEPTV